MKTHFNPGKCVATRGAKELLDSKKRDPVDFIRLHTGLVPGALCEEDRLANLQALKDGSRLFSKFDVDGHSIYVITEADRSSTTILLPEEY